MKHQRLLAAATLSVVAFLSAATWWLEVHVRGWEGLLWVHYFHFAIPIGVVLFLAWLSGFCKITPLRRRRAYLITIAALATVAYPVLYWSLYWHFGGILVWGALDQWSWSGYLSLRSIFALFPAVPIIFFLVSHAFGIRFKLTGFGVGFATYCLSIPIAILLIKLTGHRGMPDAIHAIKTGFCIPFLMLGMGLPVVLQADHVA